jgi:hypothetical protein
VRLDPSETFELAHDAVLAANETLRAGISDEVTVVFQDNAAIYYQFNSIRSSSEEQRVARMLELEAKVLIAGAIAGQLVHVAEPSEVSPYRTSSAAVCGAPGPNLALVDPRWAERATCPACVRALNLKTSGD